MGFNLATLKEKLLAVFSIDQESRETAANNIAQAIYDSYAENNDTAWTNLTLVRGWVAASAKTTPMCRKVGGMVELKGIADGTNKTANIFAALPTGFRPPVDFYTPITDGTVIAPLHVRKQLGVLTVLSSDVSTVCLNGIRFEAE